MNNEIWKNIKGYEGLYQISNLGNVRSVPRIIDSQFKGKPIKREVYEKILKKSSTKFGYDYVCLSKDGKTKKYKIHRLVGEHFIPNLENKRTINHIDGNKHNNTVENLEWATYKENQQHAIRTGLWNKEYLKCKRKVSDKE